MDVDDWNYLRTTGCVSAGCTHEAYAARGLHAPNCTQGEIDHLLLVNERLRTALAVVYAAHKDTEMDDDEDTLAQQGVLDIARHACPDIESKVAELLARGRK